MLINKVFAPTNVDIGSGRNMDAIGWENFDVQEDGEIISEKTKLNFNENSLDFIYSSHFFEHIDDPTAENLFREAYRTLKPGAVLRVVVPNQQVFIDAYKREDYEFLKRKIGKHNLSTWGVYGTNTNSPEQLLAGVIASLHNKNHRLTIWPFKEDHNAQIPVLTFPHHSKLEGYYCGPPPYISDELIKKKLETLTTHEFCLWLFSEGKISDVTSGVFASWHKNDWPLEKLQRCGQRVGFTKIEESGYGEFNLQLLTKKDRESIGKKPISLYVNFTK